MKPITRLILLAVCATVIAQSLLLWAVTGRAGFTRYYDPARDIDRSVNPSLSDLFEGTGIEDETGAMPEVPNEFRLGLMPSGFDKHIISVFTLAGPAGFAGLLLIAGPLLAKKKSRGNAE